ncbi:hypothetical protein BGZ61DRAFT_530108 [Ilyonectria robusta]|uniref:uncharacterized protein n=1 Tax=Ilyonectria robusta TaxID=1079257 RepID=UPI001E8D75C7|nr:uncharacterized protein BGZ61DRAFT_530108 [Ilyonectria robusta]KAH8729983.1 hypothetical protein BGZ61DRAFT_530108 [Ilyonectria robusta]
MDASTQFHGSVNGQYTIAAPHASHGGSNNFYFNGPDTPSPAPKPYRVIPFPRNEDVVRRSDLFAKLDALLPSTPKYGSAALWGLGGSGKTQIALEYAYRRCSDPACSVFWVHADNETTLAHDYKTIARKLGLDSKLDGEDLFVVVRERIESEPRWLLVLDNADDLALFGVGQTSDKSASLLDYVPRGPTGMVLWTSRDERIAGTLVGPRRGIGVARMTVDEAKVLLETARNERTRSEELEDATALLEELQWLPLAISQAGAYMRRTSTPIKEYLSRLVEGKERWRILKETEFDRHRRLDIPNSILETWHISIDRIRQENEIAYKTLHIIAYLDNQNIPLEVIAAAAIFSNNRQKGGLPENEQQVDRAIIRLKEFSFITAHRTEEGKRSFEMHKLVQEATRYGLNSRRLLERKPTKPKSRLREIIGISFRKQRDAKKGGWEDGAEVYFSNAALQVITKLFPERKREMWAQCETFLTHAVRVSDWAELCGREVEVTNLLTRVSDYLFDRGRWREKERVDVRAFALRRGVLGEKHPDTIRSMGELATTYHAQGRYDEAEEISVKVLELRREVLGEKHPDTIESMGSLATTYHAQGRYDEDEEISVKVLELQRAVLGEKHPDTIRSMGSLAATYHTQGRYDEDEEISVKVLELQRAVLGEKHPDTIRSMGSLATTYHAQGRYDEAEEISVKVLELQREVLGEKHPDTIRSMGELAATYHNQGRYDEAEEISVKVLELQREVLGEKHPDTIRSMRLLATIYHTQGRYDEDEEISVKVLELRRAVLGEKHPDTLEAMHDLAVTWKSQDRGDDAIALIKQCSQLRRKILGPDHPFTKRSGRALERWKTEQVGLRRIGDGLST